MWYLAVLKSACKLFRASSGQEKGRAQRPAFFVDPTLERLLLLEEVLLGVDEKDPLGTVGKDGSELDPAISGKTRKGNRWLRTVLNECPLAAIRDKNSRLVEG